MPQKIVQLDIAVYVASLIAGAGALLARYSSFQPWHNESPISYGNAWTIRGILAFEKFIIAEGVLVVVGAIFTAVIWFSKAVSVREKVFLSLLGAVAFALPISIPFLPFEFIGVDWKYEP